MNPGKMQLVYDTGRRTALAIIPASKNSSSESRIVNCTEYN